MNTKKHKMKNRAFDSEKGGGCSFFHFFIINIIIKKEHPPIIYDTLKHDETVIGPTILYTFIDLMLASFILCWQVLLFLHMIKETKKKGEGLNKQD